MSYAINALPMSDVCADRIQHQSSDFMQTINRAARMMLRAKEAAQRGNPKAEQFVARMNDDMYTQFAEWRMDEPDSE
jgi:hypothetical protein